MLKLEQISCAVIESDVAPHGVLMRAILACSPVRKANVIANVMTIPRQCRRPCRHCFLQSSEPLEIHV